MTTPTVCHPSHVADLKASGLTRETWEAAGIYTEADAKKISELLNWKHAAKKLGPCLVFPYFGLDGQPLAYHRLKPDRPRRDRTKDKRPVKYEAPVSERPRPYFPPLLREQFAGAEFIIITEGEKKALSACQHGFPTIGLSGIWSWSSEYELLPELAAIDWQARRVFIAFDSDRATNPKLPEAESRLADELTERGAVVRVIEMQPGPNGEKTGIDDFFVRGGTADQFRELIDKAVLPPEPSRRRPKGRSGREAIITGPDLYRVNNEGVAALVNDPEVFSRGGLLVRIVNEPEEVTRSVAYPSGPRIVPISAATLKERLTTVADWFKKKGKQFVPIGPPDTAVSAILDRGTWPGIRRLASITEFPVMLPDGSILATPGYDSGSRLFYVPRTECALTVPDRPTLADAKKAVAVLTDVVSDFPFAAEHHKSGWVASVLTPLARYAYRGCSPFFLIEANVPAAGKGLLADANALIVQASAFAVTTLPDKPEEFRKRITSILLRGASMALFDNLAGDFGFSELDALLTSQSWSDRLLGVNQVVELPVLTTWFGTGNNVAVIGDTARRVCPIRLESPLERPEERTDIRRPDLRGWVLSERPRLLSAALTILRAYHVAGRPNMKIPQWGSFENWSYLIRGAVVWAGLTDPWLGRAGMRDHSGDDRLTAMAGLLLSWREIDPEHTGLTCAAIVARIDGLPLGHGLHDTLLTLAGSKAREFVADKRSASLGYRVKKFAGRSIAGMRLIQAGMTNGVKRWKAERIDASRPSGDSGDSADPHSHARDFFESEKWPEDAEGKPVSTIDTIPTIATDMNGWNDPKSKLGGLL